MLKTYNQELREKSQEYEKDLEQQQGYLSHFLYLQHFHLEILPVLY